MSRPEKALAHRKPLTPRKPAPGPRKHAVTLMPGDGIGEEIAEAVVQVVEATGVSIGWEVHPSGQRALARHGTPLPPALVDSLRRTRVGLKGCMWIPLGTGSQAKHESPSLALRREFQLFVSVRPARNLAGLSSRYQDLDLVVIRENTEDLYAGIEHEVVPGVVQSMKVVTEAASTRVARFAFEYAASEGRKSVACVHKANIMKMSDGLFMRCCRAVAEEFPDIQYREIIADNCTMQLVLNPWQFDVLLMGNMMGDIISDLCAGLIGGPGTVPGIAIGPDVRVFEAIHGIAPHLEGRDLASPLTLLVPAVNMLRHIGEPDAAARILAGLEAVLRDRTALTPDLGGSSGTTGMCQAIIEKLPEAAEG